MALIKWRPKEEWDPFRDFAEHVNEDLGKLWDFPLARWHEGKGLETAWRPDIDIHEDKDNLVFRADLPGMKQEEIDISIQEDVLTIKGERKKESEVKEKNYHRVERVYGTFQRSIGLPSTVDPGKVNATYKNGVLEIALPKTEEAKPKQIKVQVK